MRETLVIKTKNAFTSIEQAGNWLKGLKKQVMQRLTPDEAMPINTDTAGERKKYLLYCVSMLNPNDYPVEQKSKIAMFRNLLMALVQGYTIEGIARMSKCSLATAKKWEKEALCYVKDAIAKKRKFGVPILGRN